MSAVVTHKLKAPKPTRRKTAAKARRQGGRPSLEDAARLGDRILDVAVELFFAHGYGATSIEAVAKRAGISKRTFYHRFADKAALFGAMLHRIIESLRPPDTLPVFVGVDLRANLLHLGKLILGATLTPQALALHRLIVGESGRFPKLATVVATEGASAQAITLIAGIITQEIRARHMSINDPQLAAEQFLNLVLGAPQRRALGLGNPMTPVELDRWLVSAVDLFLNGCTAST